MSHCHQNWHDVVLCEQHVAAGKGHSDAVALLVKKGAEVNIKGVPASLPSLYTYNIDL